MSSQFESLLVKAVDWHEGKLKLLDQRCLPQSEEYIYCGTVQEVFNSIKEMVVRGAPAIGISAAYGVVISALFHMKCDKDCFKAIYADIEHLKMARPTAVNLIWALEIMKEALISQEKSGLDVDALLRAAITLHQEDVENNYKMGELACNVFSCYPERAFSVITHCNAGGLATGGYGTALGVIRTAWNQGFIKTVFADETRPWLQGARLTAWELSKDNIPVVLNTDCAASWIMKNKGVRWVIVGADRIAANGDVVNKIGTYSLAIQAKYHDVKVMVVAPSGTVDMSVSDGDSIEIEMRDIDEIRQFRGVQLSSVDANAINPVFDVTPAKLISCIVTEKGVVEKPDPVKMKELFSH